MDNEHISESDEAIAATIREAERARHKRGLMIFVASSVGVGALWAGASLLTGGRHGPPIDLAGAEREELALTNDPVCRGMIEAITEQGEAWRKLDRRVVSEGFGQDAGKIEAVIEQVDAMRGAIEAQRDGSQAAVLRFDASRVELDVWFKDTTGTLKTLSWALKAHQASLLGEQMPESPLKAYPVEELRTKSRAALFDNFESFRVWHSTAKHPCGAAQAPK
jgi:hypothetical protein